MNVLLVLSEVNMGIKNYLIEGVACTGKTLVCNELERRGHSAIHGKDSWHFKAIPVDVLAPLSRVVDAHLEATNQVTTQSAM